MRGTNQPKQEGTSLSAKLAIIIPTDHHLLPHSRLGMEHFMGHEHGHLGK